jgi:hypothetical protein
MSRFQEFLRHKHYAVWHDLYEQQPVPQQTPLQQKTFWDRIAQNMQQGIWSKAGSDPSIAAAQQQWQALEPYFRQEVGKLNPSDPTSSTVPTLEKILKQVQQKMRGSLHSTASIGPTQPTPTTQPTNQGQPAAPIAPPGGPGVKA